MTPPAGTPNSRSRASAARYASARRTPVVVDARPDSLLISVDLGGRQFGQVGCAVRQLPDEVVGAPGHASRTDGLRQRRVKEVVSARDSVNLGSALLPRGQEERSMGRRGPPGAAVTRFAPWVSLSPRESVHGGTVTGAGEAGEIPALPRNGVSYVFKRSASPIACSQNTPGCLTSGSLLGGLRGTHTESNSIRVGLSCC